MLGTVEPAFFLGKKKKSKKDRWFLDLKLPKNPRINSRPAVERHPSRKLTPQPALKAKGHASGKPCEEAWGSPCCCWWPGLFSQIGGDSLAADRGGPGYAGGARFAPVSSCHFGRVVFLPRS